MLVLSAASSWPSRGRTGDAFALTKASVPPPKACGDYQCFYDAQNFWRSVPSPKPGQQASVPLAARAVGAAPGAPNMLVGLDNGPWSFWNVSDGFAQGRSGVVAGVSAGNVFNFGDWQYTDELYYYLHETVSVPPTQWVNAGHRNGVPVLGTVTPDCSVCGPQAAKLFTPNGYQRTVQQLYRYAVAYGFDGWIIDIEGNDLVPTPTLLQAVQALTSMTLPDGQRMRVVLYHGNEFSLGPLLAYFEAGAQWQSDYDLSTKWPARTYQKLLSNGLAAQNQRAFWASYVYAFQGKCRGGRRTTGSQISNGNTSPGTAPQCLNTAWLFANQRAIVARSASPAAPKYYTSAALFAPIWPFVGNLPDKAAPASRALAHAADEALWVGSGVRYSGPSCRRSGTANAVSAFISPRSVLGSLPFVTSFDEGEGDSYAVEGQQVASRPWNDLSVQDVLPTWYCSLAGNLKVVTTYASKGSGNAFNGGSALRVSGGSGEVEIYEARIAVSAHSKPMLAFESKTLRGSRPYVRISYSDGTSDQVSAASGTGWVQTVSPLEARGKTISAISVGVHAEGASAATLIGQVRLYDASAGDEPAPITIDSAQSVITWPAEPEQSVVSWNVYSAGSRCVRFLGPSLTNNYATAVAMFKGIGASRRYVIQPVTASGATPHVGPLCPARG